ncbi:MAG: 23S rRNA pseudouridine1911/1915/1917 synthase [Parvicellaceae bacterium]|jgi:23S rRNA pseudouridine1911/1915/1917 synthase
MFLLAEHTTPSDIEKLRIEIFCRELFETWLPSNKSIKKAIKKGAIRVNGDVVTTAHWIKAQQVIQLYDLEENPPKFYEMNLKVIYEDEFLAVIVKPAGIIVSGNEYRTIQNVIVGKITKSNEKDALAWPRTVHRLDKGTSGLMIVAKTINSMMSLSAQFENSQVKKTYQALVMGHAPEAGEWNELLENKTASSSFKRLALVNSLKNGSISHLELKPKTGRTHQLRIHCQLAGFPILGDQLYAEQTKKNKGLFLCSTEVEFLHPVSKQELHFSISPPIKFQVQLERENKRWRKFNEIDS